MKKFLILSLLLLCSCGEKTKTADDTTLLSIQVIDRNGFAETISAKDRLARYKNTDFCNPQPYQKVLRVFGKNSEGKPVSKVTSYHPNGYLKQYLEAVDGRAHGLYREWHPNGKLKMELSVIEGSAELSEVAMGSWIFEGKNTVFDDQGHLLAEILYEKGVLQGNSLYYYPEGQIKKICPYTQDKLDGSVLTYSPEGSLLEILAYANDEPHGKSASYREDGSLLFEELFEEGLLQEGTYYIHDAPIAGVHQGAGKRAEFTEGKLTRLVSYHKGSPEGLVECLTPNGSIHVTYFQKEGKKQGKETEYYLDTPSQPKIVLHWQDDMLQGLVKTWYPDGTLESEREMYQNKKNGPSLAWYKNGSLMLQEEYEKDLLTSASYYKKGDKKPVSRISKGKGTATLYNGEGYFLKKIPYEKGLPLLESEGSLP